MKLPKTRQRRQRSIPVLSFFLVTAVYFHDILVKQYHFTPDRSFNIFDVAGAFTISASHSFIHGRNNLSLSSIFRNKSSLTKSCKYSATSRPLECRGSKCSNRDDGLCDLRSSFALHLSADSDISNEDTNTDTTSNHCYDLVVIGAGPVGVKAALLASTYYLEPSINDDGSHRVALIDAPRASGALYKKSKPKQDLSIGGPTGLFSKALRDCSKKINVESLRGMGLREDSIWNEIVNSCVDLAKFNSDDSVKQLEFAGVEYIEGLASFTTGESNDDETDGISTIHLNVLKKNDDGTTHRQIRTKRALIATGSKPFRPSNIPFDGERLFDSDSINLLSYLPSSIAITGSGIIAIEYAKIFRNLGSEVTLIIRDGSPRNALMKIGLDIDVSASLVADLIRSGIKIERGAQTSSFDVPTNEVGEYRRPIKITLEPSLSCKRRILSASKDLRCDAYLAAVGRTPNTANLNLDGVGIEVDDYGGLIVDSDLKVVGGKWNVYGAGDVLGRPFLASTGVAQGVSAIQSMFGDKSQAPCIITDENSPLENSNGDKDPCIDGSLSLVGEKYDSKSLAKNPFAFPTGIWSSPEAAYYGISKRQAIELGIDAGEGVALYSECLRGLVFSPNGLLKLVHDRGNGGRIIGVHICGDDACELIHYGMELVKACRTVGEVAEELYSAVTYHEMYRIAARAAIDEKGARKRRAMAGTALAKRNREAKKS